MPHLEKDLWQPLKNSGLTVLAVGREHGLAELKEFQSKLNLSMPVLADTDRSVYNKYAKSSVPRNYLIDKNGKIAFVGLGFRPAEISQMTGIICKELGVSPGALASAAAAQAPATGISKGSQGSPAPAPAPAPATPLRVALGFMQAGNYNDALCKLDQIIAKEPNNAQAHYLLAVSYASSKKYDQAEREYKKAHELTSDPKLKQMALLGLQKIHRN